MLLQRLFNKAYLAKAGRPPIYLILEAQTKGNHSGCTPLFEQFHQEVCTALFGYLSWPRVIKRQLAPSAWQTRRCKQEPKAFVLIAGKDL